ncbi:MAG TPA: YkgJ family cysteine cluster protein [Pirellulales bacterium]|nr:YkgJ family cysteine cluster protein [Pirellulales bacterium]
MTATYECDKCGACCRFPIIEIDYVDFLREPRLREHVKPFRMPPDVEYFDDDDNLIDTSDPYVAGGLLACGSGHPCPLIGTDNSCTIYPTRPNCCVGFQAGSRLCQEARQAHGLLPLEPKKGG